MDGSPKPQFTFCSTPVLVVPLSVPCLGVCDTSHCAFLPQLFASDFHLSGSMSFPAFFSYLLFTFGGTACHRMLWMSEDSLQDLMISFHYLDPEVLKFWSSCFSPLKQLIFQTFASRLSLLLAHVIALGSLQVTPFQKKIVCYLVQECRYLAFTSNCAIQYLFPNAYEQPIMAWPKIND